MSMRFFLAGLLYVSIAAVTGCAWLGPYKVDIQQGTPLTQQQIEQITPGMSMDQVQYRLGTPSIIDPLSTTPMWQYYYQLVPGTLSKKAGIHNKQQYRFSVYFDASNTVSKTESTEPFPQDYPLMPSSNHPWLNNGDDSNN